MTPSNSVFQVSVGRIIYECFSGNCPCLTQQDERAWREKRDMQGQGSHLELVAHHSLFHDEPPNDMQVRGKNVWSSSIDRGGKSKKILPVVGARRGAYNI